VTRIYTAVNVEGFELCHPVAEDDFETINVLVNGAPRRASWKPVAVLHRGRKLAHSDAPWLSSGALIFRSTVLNAMRAMLEEFGELLPLKCSDPDLVLYNPTRVIDALDEQASSVERFASGRIMSIDRHVFRTELVSNVDVFKIPNLRVSPTYLSQSFVARWEASGLKGLEFEAVFEG
jgi:hypothetical protein